MVDDHPVVRRGLRSLLETQPGLEVCSEAKNGAEAVDQVVKGKPDLVIMDLTMPEMNGLEATRAIRKESPATDVLVFSIYLSSELAREALRAGALGYVLKADADRELLTAVEHLRARQPFFTPQLTVAMAQDFMTKKKTAAGGFSQDGGEGVEPNLTQREIDVMQLLAEGKSNKEVAAAMKVSVRTVESHRNHIMRKMSFASFSDLVRFAVRHSLVEP